MTRENVINPQRPVMEPLLPAKDRVRWGPILAGLLTTIATMLVLTVLGLALGASTFDPNDANSSDVGTFAIIWSAVSAIVSFFLGGWVAGKTAAIYGKDQGVINGLMVGVAALALILWLVSTGLGNLLGGIGSNLRDIVDVARNNINGQDASNAAANARQTALDNYDNAKNGAWGTLGGLLLALGASALGGLVGHKAKSYAEGDLDDKQHLA